MAIHLNLIDKGIYDNLVKIDSDKATEEDLLLAHSRSHVNQVFKAGIDPMTDKELKANQNIRIISDTYQNMYTTQSALISAGSTIEAVRAVCTDQVDNAFAIVRPPGHHAHCSSIGGFCFFNNVAVAAKVA
jgi:histone deacetylase 6